MMQQMHSLSSHRLIPDGIDTLPVACVPNCFPPGFLVTLGNSLTQG